MSSKYSVSAELEKVSTGVGQQLFSGCSKEPSWVLQAMMSLILLVIGCILAPAAHVLASDQSLRRSLAAADSEDFTPLYQLS